MQLSQPGEVNLAPPSVGARWTRIFDLLRNAVARLRRGELDRRKAILSAACGVFVGMLPIYGCQTLVWACLAVVFRIDPALSWALTWVNNPLTLLPILFIEIEVGSLLCTGRWQATSMMELRHAANVAAAGKHLAVGGLVVAVLSAAIAGGLADLWARRSGK